ncbi:MAG: mandelate racemase/muconate lactonizing enzyme family protein [Kiloniellales bacterium]|nr:mandelate racemase/muconate lactonizing enzyme family protein [Kiloniellales bacterium]
MRITRIRLHRVRLPYKSLSSIRVEREVLEEVETNVVAVETDAGITGHGESCAIGAVYLPTYPDAVRGGIAELAPALLGEDPRSLGRVNWLMDEAVRGQPQAKSPIDIACWDILGQAAGLPLHTLLGGRLMDRAPLYHSIAFARPDAMAVQLEGYRAEGFGVFQIKVGGLPEEDVDRIRACHGALGPGDRMFFDANRAWTSEDALRVSKALADLTWPMEQPCETYEECRRVRRRIDRPLYLDEVIDDQSDLMAAVADEALDGLVIKLSHCGGLTRARELRAAALAAGLKVRIEDTVGADIARAAVAHLAVTTPPKRLIAAYPHLNDAVTLAEGAPRVAEGAVSPGDAPGLGITPLSGVLGEPVAVHE